MEAIFFITNIIHFSSYSSHRQNSDGRLTRCKTQVLSGLVLIKTCGVGSTQTQRDDLKEQVFRSSSCLDVNEPAQILTCDLVDALEDAGDDEDGR